MTKSLTLVLGGARSGKSNHAEMLAAGGLYALLWAHQSGGFLGEA